MVFYKYHACLFRAVSDSEEMDVSQHAISGHLASLHSHEMTCAFDVLLQCCKAQLGHKVQMNMW